MNDFDSMSMLESALTYARMGYAVFPCKELSKKPDGMLVPHGCLNATKDENIIRKWWSLRPNDNVAGATGEISNGLLPVDVDDKNGHNGSVTLRDWEQKNGKLPDTATVLTPSGGVHYHYFDDTVSEYKNETDVMDGIDIRTDGGYVLLPPSKLPNGKYEWDVCRTIGEIPIPQNSEIVRELIKEAKRKKPDLNGTGDNQPGTSNTFEMPDCFKEGQRTNGLVALTIHLRQMQLTEEAIKNAVSVENEKRCIPPLTNKELEKEVFPAMTRDYAKTGTPYTVNHAVLLPEPITLNTVWNSPPGLAPELIEGVLRQGHKMILSGSSKAGKSFALIQLAFAIAEGMNWFGSKCALGKVLYINMEIDPGSFINRVKKVYNALGMNEDIHVENITVWNLRGFSMPLSQLAPEIIKKAGHDYSAVIIDPLYKVMDGDENSNSDVGRMVGHFDHIASETGASVIYAHHYAKGTGGDRSTIDRGAGAGTFARDPDAILTMTELDLSDEVRKTHRGFRIEYVLREFPDKDPVSVWYEYPIHRIDRNLDSEAVETSASKNAKARTAKQEEIRKQRNRNIDNTVENIKDSDGKFILADFEDAYARYEVLAPRTLRKRLIEAGYKAVKPVKNGLPDNWIKVR